MARKTNVLKTPPEARGPSAANNRQPMPPMAALHLAQLYQHILKVPPPRARRQIAIQIEEQAPRVIKIIHADSI